MSHQNSVTRVLNSARAVRTLAVALLVAAVVAVGAASGASAQSAGSMSFRVPFAFSAGKTALPAGEYTVQRRAANTLLIKRVDGSAAAFVTATPAEPGADADSAQLVFARFGADHVLTAVQSAGGPAYGLPGGRLNALAKSGVARVNVVVRASRG